MNRIFASKFTVFLAFSPTCKAFDYQLSGFGTASYSCFTNDHADYLINEQPEGAVRSQDCDWGIDSMLDIQLDFGPIDNLNTLIKLSYLFDFLTIENPFVKLITDNLIDFAESAGKALAYDLETGNNFSHIISVGIKHETEYGFLLSEFSHQNIDGFFRDQYSAYLTIGLYLEKWTPYATVSRRWTKGKNCDTRAGIFFSRPVSALLNATRFDNTSLSLGLAYSLQEQVTLKFQSKWIIPDHAGYGLYFNHDYEFGLYLLKGI